MHAQLFFTLLPLSANYSTHTSVWVPLKFSHLLNPSSGIWVNVPIMGHLSGFLGARLGPQDP
jgi:hypothetical protein